MGRGLDIRFFLFCFCFLSCLVYLLNTIDTDFHGPKCRIAFSVDLPTPGIWGLFLSVTLLKKFGYLKIVSHFNLLTDFDVFLFSSDSNYRKKIVRGFLKLCLIFSLFGVIWQLIFHKHECYP